MSDELQIALLSLLVVLVSIDVIQTSVGGFDLGLFRTLTVLFALVTFVIGAFFLRESMRTYVEP